MFLSYTVLCVDTDFFILDIFKLIAVVIECTLRTKMLSF